MKYEKEALSLELQADQLISRGLIADRDDLIRRLKVVNYYRLSGYLHPFRIRDAGGKVTDQYVPGTRFETVWERYNFDRRLRMILLDALERIEVALRTRLVYHFAHAHGPFGYLEEQHLPGMKQQPALRAILGRLLYRVRITDAMLSDHQKWLGKLRKGTARSEEAFVKHFSATYGDQHEALPLWMVCELMTCETLLQFLRGVPGPVRRAAAQDFGFPEERLVSWARALLSLRNACAHHARLWNRVFGVSPSVPGRKKNPEWEDRPGEPRFEGKRIWMQISMCRCWLGKISQTTSWKQRLFNLFDDYPQIPLADMGMPAAWRTHPLWL